MSLADLVSTVGQGLLVLIFKGINIRFWDSEANGATVELTGGLEGVDVAFQFGLDDKGLSHCWW